MNKLSFLIRATLAASALAASSAALAQTASVTEVNLASAGVDNILAVASNGTVVGVTNTSQYYGNTNFYLSGANGANVAQISSSPDWSYNGLNGGTTPFGVPFNQESIPTVSAVNSTGHILGDAQVFFGQDYQAVTGANGAGYTALPAGYNFNTLSDTGAMAGTTASGNVAFLSSVSGQVSTIAAPAGETTAYVSAISNTTNQIGGAFYNSATGSYTGFYTAANGGAVTTLTTPAGYVATDVQTINDSGEVGGSITYNAGAPVTYQYYCGGASYCGGGYYASYSYQPTGTTAILTDPTTGAIVPIAVGSPGDSTATLFLNNAGDALVGDETTGATYLYDAGQTYDLGTLFGTGEINPYTVVGFTATDEIVVNDPTLYIFSAGQSLSGGVDNKTTSTYTTFELTNTAPTAGFSSRGDSFGQSAASGISGGGTGSSVPEPALFLLFGLALAALGLKRRKGTAEGIVGV